MWTAAQKLFYRMENSEQSCKIELALRQISATGRIRSAVHRAG